MNTKLDLKKIKTEERKNCQKCKGDGYVGYMCHGEYHSDACSDCGTKYTQAQVEALIQEVNNRYTKLVGELEGMRDIAKHPFCDIAFYLLNILIEE